MEIKTFVGAIIASAILYRLGGATGFNTKLRDLGCPTVCFAFLLTIIPFHWLWIISFGLMFASLTTYWDWLFGYDNFYFHGFMIGLSLIPLIYIFPWYMVLLRAVILAVSFGLINKFANKWQIPHSDDVEELSRGALLILTLFILTKLNFVV